MHRISFRQVHLVSLGGAFCTRGGTQASKESPQDQKEYQGPLGTVTGLSRSIAAYYVSLGWSKSVEETRLEHWNQPARESMS